MICTVLLSHVILIRFRCGQLINSFCCDTSIGEWDVLVLLYTLLLVSVMIGGGGGGRGCLPVVN